MKFLNHFKIRAKLFTSFLVMLLLAVTMAIVGILNMNSVLNRYETMMAESEMLLKQASGIKEHFGDMRLHARGFWIYTDNPFDPGMEEMYRSFDQSRTNLFEAIAISQETARTYGDEEYLNLLGKIEENVTHYGDLSDSLYNAVRYGNMEEAYGYNDEFLRAAITPSFVNNINEYIEKTQGYINSQNKESNLRMERTSMIMIFLTVLIFIGGLLLTWLISDNISKPLNDLAEAAASIAYGNLNVHLQANRRDEIGFLSEGINVVVLTLETLVEDIQRVYQAHTDGDYEAKVDESRFEGAYKNLAKGINEVLTGMAADIVSMLMCVDTYANGDFKTEPPVLPGKKMILTNNLNRLRNHLVNIITDIKAISEAIAYGRTDVYINLEPYQNDWRDITGGLNRVLDLIAEPVKETMQVVNAMAQGNLSVRMKGEYSGEYDELKTSLNRTLDKINGYIREISYVLTEMSHENFDLSVQLDYIGDFTSIKESLVKIIATFNSILADINGSAENISEGAGLIAESSVQLAEGATEQAASVNLLSGALNDLTEDVSKNVEVIVKSNQLAVRAKGKALVGNEEMESMAEAMDEIYQASINISKINDIVDNIAFQTNLLALNASVEAARAGEHGKGFSIVAEEVRGLANRSKEAAKETNDLLKSAMDKASEGSGMTGKIANTFKDIVDEITDISNALERVAETTKNQDKSIQKINLGLTQISMVTQKNSASAEEEASYAEVLSSQSDVFRDVVSRFKIKDQFRKKKKDNNKEGKV